MWCYASVEYFLFRFRDSQVTKVDYHKVFGLATAPIPGSFLGLSVSGKERIYKSKNKKQKFITVVLICQFVASYTWASNLFLYLA